GTIFEDIGANLDQGATYVYTRAGGTWRQMQKLTATNGGGSDSFGYSVSLSADGFTAIIGALTVDVGTNTDQGSSYLFTLNPAKPSASISTGGGNISLRRP